MRQIGTIVLLLLMGIATLVAGFRLSEGESANSRIRFVHPSPDYPLSINLSDKLLHAAPQPPVSTGVRKSGADITLDSSHEGESSEEVEKTSPRQASRASRISEIDSEQKENNRETELDEAPERLVIPALKVNTKIVYVPFSEMTWDISNLGPDIAWLGNPAGGSNRNNITLAGHVTLYDGRNGPLYSAARLKPGDTVYVYFVSRVFSYQLYAVSVVYPREVSILEETASPQLTLITCTTWDEKTSSYLRRLVFQFRLVKVEPMALLVIQ